MWFVGELIVDFCYEDGMCEECCCVCVGGLFDMFGVFGEIGDKYFGFFVVL